MKKILIIALTLIAFTTANAETTTTTEATQTTTTVKAVEIKETNDATAVGAPDNSARYVGTNDLNLFILRQGVKKA